MTTLAENTSSNAVIRAAQLTLWVTNPSGAEVYRGNANLGDLAPGVTLSQGFDHRFQGAPVGEYTAQAELRDGAGTLLATAQTRYTVAQDLAQTLSGQVQAQPSLTLGETQTCIAALQLTSGDRLTDLAARLLVLALPSGTVQTEHSWRTDLAVGMFPLWPQAFPTADWTAGDYSCVLQVRVAGEWRTLAHAPFTLLRGNVEAQLSLGGSGRLLVHLDDPAAVAGLEQTPLPNQWAWLENRLAGQSYTLTADAEVLKRAQRSGRYPRIALLHGQQNLSADLQRELREASYRGAGLLMAPGRGVQPGALEAALGLTLGNLTQTPVGFELRPNPWGLPVGAVALGLPRKTQDVRLQGAESLGVWGGGSAVTRHAYGLGRTLWVGFDLLDEASFPTAHALLPPLLDGALKALEPTSWTPTPGASVPVQLSLHNRDTVAQDLQLLLQLPAGALALDAGAGGVMLPEGVRWNLTLAADETQVLPLWVELPTAPGMTQFTATLTTADPVPVTTSLMLNLSAQPGLAEALTHLDTLAVQDVRYLDARTQAQAAWDWRYPRPPGTPDPEAAIAALLSATDVLATIATPEAAAVRLLLDQALWETGRAWVAAQP